MTAEEFEKGKREILSKDDFDVSDLIKIISLLRSEYGCPWDKVQTHESLRSDLIEETYETVEAIDCADPDMLYEELGDLLIQIVFHAGLEEDAGRHDLKYIADVACKKLVSRHPHVFFDKKADTVDEVLKNWDAIKKDEKKQESYTDTLKSVPKVFPSLMRAQKLGKRAGRAGIDFDDTAEMQELLQSCIENAQYTRAMFILANIMRREGSDPETELAEYCDGFIKKFEQFERTEKELSKVSPEELY